MCAMCERESVCFKCMCADLECVCCVVPRLYLPIPSAPLLSLQF